MSNRRWYKELRDVRASGAVWHLRRCNFCKVKRWFVPSLNQPVKPNIVYSCGECGQQVVDFVNVETKWQR